MPVNPNAAEVVYFKALMDKSIGSVVLNPLMLDMTNSKLENSLPVVVDLVLTLKSSKLDQYTTLMPVFIKIIAHVMSRRFSNFGK